MHWADTDFFDQTFDETLALLEETRTHIDQTGSPLERAVASSESMLRTTRDLSYLTSQVTGIMSLLLLHKAIADGVIPRDELAPRARILMDDLDMTGAALHQRKADLPPEIASLMERGDKLNQRIHRLQDIMEKGAA